MPIRRFITVSVPFAIYVVEMCTALIRNGWGIDYDPDALNREHDFSPHSIIDNVPDEYPGGEEWKNALFQALRFISGTLHHLLRNAADDIPDLEIGDGDLVHFQDDML